MVFKKKQQLSKMKFPNQLLPGKQPEASGGLVRSVILTVKLLRKHPIFAITATNLYQNKMKLLMYATPNDLVLVRQNTCISVIYFSVI